MYGAMMIAGREGAQAAVRPVRAAHRAGWADARGAWPRGVRTVLCPYSVSYASNAYDALDADGMKSCCGRPCTDVGSDRIAVKNPASGEHLATYVLILPPLITCSRSYHSFVSEGLGLRGHAFPYPLFTHSQPILTNRPSTQRRIGIARRREQRSVQRARDVQGRGLVARPGSAPRGGALEPRARPRGARAGAREGRDAPDGQGDPGDEGAGASGC